jgi:hypothetical protein
MKNQKLTPRRRVLERLVPPQLPKTFSTFFGSEVSLQRSQEPPTKLCPAKPDESSLHFRTLVIKNQF